MIKSLIRLSLLILVLIPCNKAFSQQITGTVVDEEKLPLEFVSVALLQTKDSLLVQYTLTGEDVTKILVDGKEFFNNDMTIALKNLNADAIKSVQIIDKESDDTRTTGIKDGEKSKIIKLVLSKGKNLAISVNWVLDTVQMIGIHPILILIDSEIHLFSI